MFGRVIAMAPIRILEDIVGRGEPERVENAWKWINAEELANFIEL